MQKNKYIFLLIALLIGSAHNLWAERTSGYCSMKEEEKGKEVLSLYPHVYFYCATPGQIYSRIWIDAWVRTSDLYDGIRLLEKTKLFDKNRKLIAKVTLSFNPMKIMEETDSLTHIVLSGYIEKSCIDNTYVPENELSKLLEKAENNEKYTYFYDFIGRYEFSETKENNSYTSYLLNEPNFTQQLLEPRLLLVFYKSELIAIFHTRDLTVKRYDSIEMGSQYKMIYNSKFSEHTKKEMVDIYKRKLQP
ncbi:MAG: hypothetical protein CFE21_01685 [Bacteroidetes bacterium B1(2017)]|nr:MAG: hypothetical protein CFE21_01685 [Bacteroidetes bacterium B1(2017)]